jgi:hypothetical protein
MSKRCPDVGKVIWLMLLLAGWWLVTFRAGEVAAATSLTMAHGRANPALFLAQSQPTGEPTGEATVEVTTEPPPPTTGEPTVAATTEATVEPTTEPTAEASPATTTEPAPQPGLEPTVEPTAESTVEPTVAPTIEPVELPAGEPTGAPGLTPTAGPVVEATANPTATPEPALVNGAVAYQGRADRQGFTITVTGSEEILAQVDPTGHFTVTGLVAGDYRIIVDAEAYLPVCVTLSLSDGTVTSLAPARLAGGDLNNDEQIKINDVTLIGSNFGLTASTTPAMNPRADINADGQVNVLDLSILGGNFGKRGCQDWFDNPVSTKVTAATTS